MEIASFLDHLIPIDLRFQTRYNPVHNLISMMHHQHMTVEMPFDGHVLSIDNTDNVLRPFFLVVPS